MVVSNFSSKGGVAESKKSSRQQPCLSITDREIFRIQTNMFNNKHPLVYDVGGEIPEFLGRDIACSFGEWVLLSGNSTHKLYDILVNLLSKEIIELPSFDFTYNFCTLTSHPYDPTCHIVFFSRPDNTLRFCQPGDKEFTTKKWDYELFPTQPVVVAGKLFLYLGSPAQNTFPLGIIEFKESTYQFEEVEMDRENRYAVYYGSTILFEYSGELFIVCQVCRSMSPGNLSGFEIFKADFLNKKWVIVKSLGRVAIFIGYLTAHVQCASVESGIEANSIYFLQDGDLDNYYIYNLMEGTIRLKPAFSSVEMETTVYKDLNWIMMPPCDAFFPKLLKDSEKENRPSLEVEVGVQNSWNTVPSELLNLIQLHLFGRDHAVFRVVCKAWEQASIPALLSSTTLLELCQSSSPLLMFQEDMTISDDSVPIFRFLDPVHKKLYRTEIPELRETDIQYSKDGWLLVTRRGDGSIFFFNPLTQEKIELPGKPVSDFCGLYYSLSFSSLPTCSNCLVVVMHRYLKAMFTLKHGEETWRRVELDEEYGTAFDLECWREYGNCPVVINGLHHFMFENRDVVVFNLKESECLFADHHQFCPSKSEPSHLVDDFFLEIDGALALVSVEQNGRELSMFKWNYVKKDWELMEEGGVDFGGKEMFLRKTGGSFMEKIDDGGGMGNAIFLPMIDHDAKERVFYSLATHKYHTFYNGYSWELPYNVDKFLNGVWVQPDREIVGDINLKW